MYNFVQPRWGINDAGILADDDEGDKASLSLAVVDDSDGADAVSSLVAMIFEPSMISTGRLRFFR